MVYNTIIRYVFKKRFGSPVYASILKKRLTGLRLMFLVPFTTL